jgi:hypothetical protein
MIAERASEARSAQTTTQQPRRFLSGVIKHIFREAKACLAPQPQPKRKKCGDDGTQRGFARAKLEIGTLARALFLHYLPPAFDDGLSIHLWHENNQQDDMAGHDLSAQVVQNYLSLHL